MTPTNEQIELLERYLAGQLSVNELQTLEQTLSSDPELRAYLTLLQGFEGLHRAHFQTQLGGWERKHQQQTQPIATEPPAQKPTFWVLWGKQIRRYAGAAVLVLGLMPLGYWLFQNVDKSPATLAMGMFEAPMYTTSNVRGLSEHKTKVETTIEKGASAYNSKSYREAITQFSQVLALSPEATNEISFYLGVSYLGNNQPKEAIALFEKITVQENSQKEPASWYLALALIKDNQLERGIKELQKITQNPKHPKSQKAQELLKMLQ